MSISSLDSLIAAYPRVRRSWLKNTLAGLTVGNYGSLWAVTGAMVGDGGSPANTTTGVVPTDSTPGAVSLPAVPGGQSMYLADVQVGTYVSTATSNANGLGWLLYDRLWHAGPFTATSLGTTTLTPVALTRPNATGLNTELWLECTATAQPTAVTMSVSYTNSSGTSGQTAVGVEDVATLTSDSVGRAHRFQLATGDYGVQSVQSVTIGGATNATGQWNVMILRPVQWITGHTLAYGSMGLLDPFHTGMPQIYANACLAWMVMALGAGNAVSPMIADIGLVLA